MSVAFVQVKDSGNNGSGSGSSSTVAITPTAGNLLIIACHQASSNALSSVTDTNGTPVAITSGVNNGLSSVLYYVPNVAGGSHSITVTFASTGWTDLAVFEYSGAVLSNPIDNSGYGHGASGSAPTVNVTTNGPGRMLASYVHAENTALSAGSGFTSRDTFDNNQVQDQLTSSQGTFAAGSPTSASGNWTSLVAAIIGVSNVASATDSRTTKPSSATSRTVQGTLIYDVQTSANSTVPPTDSRAAGAPVDSRVAAIIPQNSRAALG